MHISELKNDLTWGYLLNAAGVDTDKVVSVISFTLFDTATRRPASLLLDMGPEGLLQLIASPGNGIHDAGDVHCGIIRIADSVEHYLLAINPAYRPNAAQS